MQSFQTFLTEASFQKKHFPPNVGTSKDITDVGDHVSFKPKGGTPPYIPMRGKDYKYPEGFPMFKASSLYSKDGEVLKKLSKGDRVHFTIPATLHWTKEFDIRGTKSICAAVSLKGYKKKMDGYVKISTVDKPAGEGQARVQAGHLSQNAVALYVKELVIKKGIEIENEFKTARAGSAKPDLVMTINKKRTQFEIKGTAGGGDPLITFFDKSVNRGGREIKVIQELADIYIDNLKVDGKKVSTEMKSMKLPSTFVGIIDYFKSRNSTVGFAGDEGVKSSGKLPSEFAITDSSILSKLRKVVIDHFKEGKDGGDDYFIIHNKKSNTFKSYYVGGGSAGNVLKLPELPNFKSFLLATYGGKSSGSTRVGLKIRLK